jgi:hypothetical protein
LSGTGQFPHPAVSEDATVGANPSDLITRPIREGFVQLGRDARAERGVRVRGGATVSRRADDRRAVTRQGD